jgi:hypothetical protein
MILVKLPHSTSRLSSAIGKKKLHIDVLFALTKQQGEHSEDIFISACTTDKAIESYLRAHVDDYESVSRRRRTPSSLCVCLSFSFSLSMSLLLT